MCVQSHFCWQNPISSGYKTEFPISVLAAECYSQFLKATYISCHMVSFIFRPSTTCQIRLLLSHSDFPSATSKRKLCF